VTQSHINKPRVLVFAGTRPECIKLASVVEALRRQPGIDTVLINSGQHRLMVEQTFAHLGQRSDLQLESASGHHSLSHVLAHLRTQALQAIVAQGAAAVIVQGDTTTAYAGALAARDAGVPLAHIEAGLRTDHPYRPFPEELFRRRIAPLARWNLAPTVGASANLLREGIVPETIHMVGNTGIDALRLACAALELEPGPPAATATRLITLTLHRRENYGRNLDIVCAAMLALLERHPDLRLTCPVHNNPAVGSRIRRLLANHPSIELTEPLAYCQFVGVLRRSALVITDSGGIQEEAPYLGLAVLVARENTERPEAAVAGATELVSLDQAAILVAAERLLAAPRRPACGFDTAAPFGDGYAGARIASILSSALSEVRDD
jgi:UDP-N-acetylglucosamine 2-epimerase (non-hydrolysing)